MSLELELDENICVALYIRVFLILRLLLTANAWHTLLSTASRVAPVPN